MDFIFTPWDSDVVKKINIKNEIEKLKRKYFIHLFSKYILKM